LDLIILYNIPARNILKSVFIFPCLLRMTSNYIFRYESCGDAAHC